MTCVETPICNPCNPDYTDTGCTDFPNSECVIYNGDDIPCLNITKTENLNEVLQHIKDVVCALTPTVYSEFDYSCFSTEGITTEQEFVEFISSLLCDILGSQTPSTVTSLSSLYSSIQSLLTDVNLIKNQTLISCFQTISGLTTPQNIGVLLTAIQTILCDHEDRITALEVDGSLALTANDSATIDFTTSGTLNHTLTGSVKLSAVANNALTAQVDGIHVLSPVITANDSDSINFTASGTHSHTLTGEVKLSADPGNILSIESDGLLAAQVAIDAQDSSTINFTNVDDVTFTGVVIIDPNPANALSSTGSGLFVNTSGFSIADNSVTNAKLRDSIGYSVIGRTSGSTGDPADIQASTDQVLRRSGSGNLEFGTLVTNNIGDSQVTFSKIANINTSKILGRTTAGSGVIEELSIGTGLSLSGGTLSLGSVPISYLSAATAGNTINNINYPQIWQWNSLSGSNGLKLSTSSTVGSSQILFDVRMSGARATATYSGMTAYFENNQTGTNGTNNAVVAYASGGTENYGVVCSGAGGQWGTSGGASIYAQGRMRIDGQIDTYGSTSGIVTIKPAANAGTWTLTLPTSDGSNKDVLQTDGSGVTSWAPLITEGTYTPTLVNGANVAASTASVTNYARIGNTVTVWGKVTIDATAAATPSVMTITLPVASAVGGTNLVAGTGACNDGTPARILSDNTSDIVSFEFTPVTNTNNIYSFHFSYTVV